MHTQENGMKTEMMKITPEMAKLFLQNNNGNRKIRTKAVKQLSDAIRRGEWVTTHQGIAFNRAGDLIDGQHRLTACVEADISIECMVTYDVDAGAFGVLDSGIVRSMADRLPGMDPRVVEVLRYATEIIVKVRPTEAQVTRHAVHTVLTDTAARLIEHAPTSSRTVGTAAVRLGACLSAIVSGSDAYAFSQYRALTLRDYDAMSNLVKHFCRRADQGEFTTGGGSSKLTLLCVAMSAFDESKADNKQVKINDDFRVDWLVKIRAIISALPKTSGEG